MLYPLTFHPIFKERVWGGRKLGALYQKQLPPRVPIGESWEISDRPDGVSVVANGPLAGKNLRWLMEHHARELLGRAQPAAENRFPLLCKILDSREKSSLQVHPPADQAAELGGEPKTEMWFIADAVPGAEVFVGLKRGVTRAGFGRKISDGRVADCFHRIFVQAGDAMFLPGGRVHAIGAGLVIFEIQQNSDTTYRIFDWNRVGLDGKPRELHIAESLASIDFSDVEPGLVQSRFAGREIKTRPLVQHPLFNIEVVGMDNGASLKLKPHRLQVVAAVSGQMAVRDDSTVVNLCAGQFCLVPASLERAEVLAISDSVLLRVEVN